MANIFEFLSKDGNITPEKARKSRQMQFRDKTAYVWGLRYRWDPSLSRNPVPWFPHFMSPCREEEIIINKSTFDPATLFSPSPSQLLQYRHILHNHTRHHNLDISWSGHHIRNNLVIRISILKIFIVIIITTTKIWNAHHGWIINTTTGANWSAANKPPHAPSESKNPAL